MLARNRAGFPPPSGLPGGRALPGPNSQGPSGARSPGCTRFLQKRRDTPRGSAPRWGRAPSGTSRPPYLTRAASPGRHHGAAGPVRLLRRRHLPAPGPRPRRQPRPVPDGASTFARDFTFGPPGPATVSEQSASSHAPWEAQPGHRTALLPYRFISGCLCVFVFLKSSRKCSDAL